MGEQWLRLNYNAIILVVRIILIGSLVVPCSFTLHHHSCFFFKYVAKTSLYCSLNVLFRVDHHDFSPSQFHSIHPHLIVLFSALVTCYSATYTLLTLDM